MPAQTLTPLDLVGRPDKDALLAQFKHKSLESLRTPALLIDRKIFAANAARMHTNAREWGAQLRAHLKTHKVGTRSRDFVKKMPHCRADRRGNKAAAGICTRLNLRHRRFDAYGSLGGSAFRAGFRGHRQRCK